MNQTRYTQWKQIKWLLLGCVPLFFLLRGIHLILTGGGWIVTSDQHIHWILLFIEMIIAAFTIYVCFFLWYQESYIVNKKILRRMISIKTIILTITFTFIIHFVRVGFWIQNSVLLI
jgi:hypothetical protein